MSILVALGQSSQLGLMAAPEAWDVYDARFKHVSHDGSQQEAWNFDLIVILFYTSLEAAVLREPMRRYVGGASHVCMGWNGTFLAQSAVSLRDG